MKNKTVASLIVLGGIAASQFMFGGAANAAHKEIRLFNFRKMDMVVPLPNSLDKLCSDLGYDAVVPNFTGQKNQPLAGIQGDQLWWIVCARQKD